MTFMPNNKKLFIELPEYAKDFKHIPDEVSKCSFCGKKITNNLGNAEMNVVWYFGGFAHYRCYSQV